MTIPALDSISLGAGGAVTPTSYLGGAAALPGSGGVTSAFGPVLTGAVENLQGLQDRSNALAVRAVTGDLDDVHDYTIAATEAKVTLELTAAVRNKAVEAFSEIMRMQA